MIISINQVTMLTKTVVIVAIILMNLLFPLIMCQQDSSEDFKEFLGYFNHPESSESVLHLGKEIPKPIIMNAIGAKYYDDHAEGYSSSGIISDKENITLILEASFPEGGYTGNYYIITFSRHGKLLNFSFLGFNMLDGGGGAYCTLYFLNDSILEVRQEDIVTKNDKDSTLHLDISYYQITYKGYAKLKIPELNFGRKYGISSIRILREKDLSELPKSELDILRNEIFAAHGYIFKTRKWQDYFSEQDWYNPHYENVNDKLTLIEKINIGNILKVSSSMTDN